MPPTTTMLLLNNACTSTSHDRMAASIMSTMLGAWAYDGVGMVPLV